MGVGFLHFALPWANVTTVALTNTLSGRTMTPSLSLVPWSKSGCLDSASA